MFDAIIRFQARHRPHATALVRSGGDISFRTFDDMIDRIGVALKRAGAAQATLAAVKLPDLAMSWVVLLALARLGVGMVSFAKASDLAVIEGRIDLLIVEEGEDGSGLPSVATIVASSAWFADCLAVSAEPLGVLRLDPLAIGHVILSSGTTGQRKAIARPWVQAMAAIAQRQVTDSAFRSSSYPIPKRTLSLFGLDTVVFYHVLALWASGGALIIPDREYLERDGGLPKLAPTLLLASPVQLERLVSRLPADFALMPDLVVVTGGSHLAMPLREAVLRRLAPTIWNIYGSSEAAIVTMADVGRLAQDPTAAGWLLPFVEAEVVDEGGVALPAGQEGTIRIRSPAVASAYLDDPAGTAAQFKDGWFYSGDFGSLGEDGLLRLAGRVSELMNLGGVKVLPGTIENAARACPGVFDVAAFSVVAETGVEKPWLAIVRGEGFEERAVVRALEPLRLPPIFLAWVGEIPRNAGGKIERNRLRAAAERDAERAIKLVA